MNSTITIEFLKEQGFIIDGKLFKLKDKIEVYMPSDNYSEVYVKADDNPDNYSVHFVNCRTNDDLTELIRLL
jgi:hypothetical protein